MKVITVIDDERDPNFNLLRLSCALNGLKLVTLISTRPKFVSKRIKDELLADYLLEEKDDDIILFSDGTDAILLSDEKEILSKFSAFNCDLVFSAEMGCFPDRSMASEYYIDQNTPYNYLNSGGFIGKIGIIKELLNEGDFFNANFKWSNQYLWSRRYLKNSNRIKLDRYCSIFCTLFTDYGETFFLHDPVNAYNHKKEWFDANMQIRKNRLFNSLTRTSPCHVHFNGSAKLLLNEKIIRMVHAAIPGYIEPEFYFET